MTTTRTRLPVLEAPPRPRARRWRWAHSLAVVGGMGAAYGLWTMVSWLLDGPQPVTRYQTSDEASYYIAHMLEAIVVVGGLAVGIHVVRNCVRQRRLTFDAMLCIAGALSMWSDPVITFFQPTFMYSSNFVNLQAWCGHLPGVINPDCGRMAYPVLFLFPTYTFGLLGIAIVINAYMRALRRRWPGISTLKLLALTVAVTLVFEVALEFTLVSNNVWSYPGSPSWMSLLGAHHRLPVTEFLSAVVFFLVVPLVRYYKDDAGRTIAERGLESLRPATRYVVTTLALCGVVQLTALQNTLSASIPGFYSSPYPDLPASLIIGMCDSSGFEGTRYGPCPGSPGFRMPVRTLPGDDWSDPEGLKIPDGR